MTTAQKPTGTTPSSNSAQDDKAKQAAARQAERDKADDAALSQVLGRPVGKGDPEDSGDTSDTAIADAAGTPEPKKPSVKPGAVTLPENLTKRQRTDYLLAHQALKRDGWTEEDISDLPPERIIRVGLKRKQVQDENQRNYAQSRKSQPTRRDDPADDLDGDDEEEEAPPRKGRPDPSRDSGRRTADPDADDSAEEGEHDEHRKADSERRPTKDVATAALKALVTSAKRTLLSDFPGLKNQERLENVLRTMDQLNDATIEDSLDIDHIEGLMRKACYAEFGSNAAKRGKPGAADEAADDDDGDAEPLAPSKRTPDRGSLSGDELDDLAIKSVLGSNGNFDEAQRRFNNGRPGIPKSSRR